MTYIIAQKEESTSICVKNGGRRTAVLHSVTSSGDDLTMIMIKLSSVRNNVLLQCITSLDLFVVKNVQDINENI